MSPSLLVIHLPHELIRTIWVVVYLAVFGCILYVWTTHKAMGTELLVYLFTILGEAVFPGICAWYINRVIGNGPNGLHRTTIPTEVLELSGHVSLTLVSGALLLGWGTILWLSPVHENQRGAFIRLYILACVLTPFGVALWALVDESSFTGYRDGMRQAYFSWVWPAMVDCPMSWSRMVLTILTLLLPLVVHAGKKEPPHTSVQEDVLGGKPG